MFWSGLVRSKCSFLNEILKLFVDPSPPFPSPVWILPICFDYSVVYDDDVSKINLIKANFSLFRIKIFSFSWKKRLDENEN